MAQDDWRLRIELGGEGAHGLLRRLGVVDTDADMLARELIEERLAVTHDEDTVFVYGATRAQVEAARPAIERELGELRLEPKELVVEQWLDEDDRWDSEPEGETVEEEAVSSGYAPWEVRVECGSHDRARKLADELEAEGYGVVRRWSFVIAGTATREEANELAARVHGEVEAGGELVYETRPKNPFAVFGGLGSA